MMKRLFKQIVVVMLLTILTSGIALAADKKITSVDVEVKDNGEKRYPSIRVKGNCTILDIVWDKEEDEMAVGSRIKATISLEPKSGYFFKERGKVKFSVQGTGKDQCSTTHLAKEGGCTLYLIYTVEGEPEPPEEAYWSESKPWTAKTDRVKNALKYKFTLYRGPEVVATKTTSGPNCDFSVELSESGVCSREDIYFEVQAVRGDNESEAVGSDYYAEWEELKLFCKKTVNREWNWKKKK